MMRSSTLFLFIVTNICTFGHTDSGHALERKDDQICTVVEIRALFPGGFDALRNHIAKNLKYPEDAKKDSIVGKVVVQFTVDSSGNIPESE